MWGPVRNPLSRSTAGREDQIVVHQRVQGQLGSEFYIQEMNKGVRAKRHDAALIRI